MTTKNMYLSFSKLCSQILSILSNRINVSKLKNGSVNNFLENVNNFPFFCQGNVSNNAFIAYFL